MKTNKIIILLLFIFLQSCKKEKYFIEYYKNGIIKKECEQINGVLYGECKEYYETGNLKALYKYRSGVLIDSALYFYDIPIKKLKSKSVFFKQDSIKQIYYYENGNIKEEGFINSDNKKVGMWKFYNKSQLTAKREYKIIKNEEFLNQTYTLNNKLDTIYSKSKFFELFILKDTIRRGEYFNACALLKANLFKNKNSEILLCIPKYENENFNKDFSNENLIELDTFYNLMIDKKNQKLFIEASKPYTVIFNQKLNNPGNKIIKGFIMEYYQDIDSLGKEYREVSKSYFEFDVYVK